IDLYRLDRIEEIADLGLEEYFYGKGVCVVEWAEKGPEIVPQESLLISLHYISTSETERSIHLKPRGERYRELTKQLTMKGDLWH
ncbi:MAG: tRNA (adenosine(37)-N6)-threonylcarbamoyltransferase complex ATPase subunit type 1 TsaE, partial [Chloroflexi bacterium]